MILWSPTEDENGDNPSNPNFQRRDTPARLQSLMSGKVAGGMMTPPSTYLAMDQGYQVLGRGRDYMRFLQTGVVATDHHIKQKRELLLRFLRAWNQALKFYQDHPEIMLPYIQKNLP